METNLTNDELQSLNIFERLQLLRIDIQKANLKQSGINKFANYKYFDLKDIVPTINILLLKYKLTTHITFTNEMATLTIINCHKPDEKIIFTSPMRDLEIKGLNKIQVLGGVETYQRRYLYLIAFDIVESDLIEIQKALPISSNQIETIQKHADKIGALLKKFNISDIKNLSHAQADYIIKKLTDWKGENILKR